VVKEDARFPVLTNDEAGAMEAWVAAANLWSLALQSVVQTSTALATESRDLADRFDGDRGAAPAEGTDGQPPLAGELRRLADEVESDTGELRNRYVATAGTLAQFGDILD
jgi:hypothetical protein